jgi:hypothetical protein
MRDGQIIQPDAGAAPVALTVNQNTIDRPTARPAMASVLRLRTPLSLRQATSCCQLSGCG